ncbi:hypothetical protein VTN02DRAFT_3405 [Thermoascus thermophilus]
MHSLPNRRGRHTASSSSSQSGRNEVSCPEARMSPSTLKGKSQLARFSLDDETPSARKCDLQSSVVCPISKLSSSPSYPPGRR